MDDFVMANFCHYAYQSPDTLANFVFRDGLRFGGNEWTFNRNNYFYDDVSQIQCYIFTTVTSSDIALVFRGTDNPRNWTTNNLGNFKYELWPGDVQGSKVGAGWLKGWNGLKGQVLPQLNTMLTSATRIFVCGHSMGAAVATIAVVDIGRQLGHENITLRLIGIGAPLVGNRFFCDYFEMFIKQRGSYTVYRDPNDWVMNFFIRLMQIGTDEVDILDPYRDFQHITLTNPGDGHAIISYLSLLNPDEIEYTVKDSSEALCPDTPIETFTIAIAASSYLVTERPNLPPFNLSFRVGLNPNDFTGGIELPLYPASLPFFSPGELRFFSFDASKLNGMHVLALQFCGFFLEMTCQTDTESCNMTMKNPILLDGVQLIVNGFPLFTNFRMKLNISLNASGVLDNSNVIIYVPTPHYEIVGGRRQITNDTSTEPLLTVDEWGMKGLKEVEVSNARCWTQKWGMGSYCYTSFYLQPIGTIRDKSRQWVVGGNMMVTDGHSNDATIEEIFWGERSSCHQFYTNNHCWISDTEVYGYTGLYLTPQGAASTNQPRVLGGRMLVRDASSVEPLIQVLEWGESSPYEVNISNGNCYSKVYGGNSYGYTTFFTDRPVPIEGLVIKKLTISLLSIQCVKSQEGEDWLGGRDEIYIMMDGVKKWPGTLRSYSIGDDEVASVYIDFTIDTVTPLRLELWEDDLFSGQQLYEFFFTNRMLALDPQTSTYVLLEDCLPNKLYHIQGRQVDGTGYFYYLTVYVATAG